MKRELDLADIQGNVVRAYGQYGYPHARYFCFNVSSPVAGRVFVDNLRAQVTTAERWARGSRNYRGEDAVPRPPVTVNTAFTFRGLMSLNLPTRTLRQMPDEFIDGMAKRAIIIGDTGPSGVEHWDRVWRDGCQYAPASPDSVVHIWVSVNAQAEPDGSAVPELEAKTDWLRRLCKESAGGVRMLTGHGPDNAEYQAAKALMASDGKGNQVPTGKEHFGYTDGIGNPVFSGQYEPEIEAQQVIGRGKLLPDQTWAPLATGEFILGYPDESQALPPTAPPADFLRNGTFMAFRKLHQNVAAFNEYLDETAAVFAREMNMPVPEARETVMAKFIGRWSDGVPLIAAPTFADWKAFGQRFGDLSKPENRLAFEQALIDFKFRDDLAGSRCPVGAHIRRVNTRDLLDPKITSKDVSQLSGSALNNRRRILRRGLPYGSFDPADDGDDKEHGVAFIVMCASLFRQFEFIQQQWIHYGLDFNAGNDTCPVLGNRDQSDRFVIQNDPKGGKPPFICNHLPQFVTAHGGDYFFIPSITALRMIAMGIVDPT